MVEIYGSHGHQRLVIPLILQVDFLRPQTLQTHQVQLDHKPKTLIATIMSH